MRICLAAGIFPPDIGGPASYVPQIALRLQERGHRLEVITLADRPGQGTASYPFAVHALRRGEMRSVRMVRTVIEITRVARRSDLVFANGLFLEAAVAARVARRPLVVKIVGDWAWERASNWGLTRESLEEFQARAQGLRPEGLKHLRTLVVRQAAFVIVPSQYLGSIVRGWGIEPGRIVCVYNASEQPRPETPWRLPGFDGATLCTVARLVPWKGIEGLIKLLTELPHVRLVVIGEGPQRVHLEETARELGVSSRVIFAGRLEPLAVAGCLSAADLFVLNSEYEGLPHVILEAFEAGVPVLATAVGGVPEVVENGKNGWLVTPGQEQELLEAVKRLLSDAPLRQRFVREGRRTIRERFTWSRTVVETEEVLSRALQRKGAQGA